MARHDTAAPIVAVALAILLAGPVTGQEAVQTIIDFTTPAATEWFPVNDGVMGGRSSSTMRHAGDDTAVFEGTLSLENNGGFASVRTEMSAAPLTGFSRVLLRVRGDGKRYQVRLRMSTGFDGVAYGAGFETIAGEWMTVTIPIQTFEPTYRGFQPPDAPPLDFASVRQFGLMLTDKQAGPFRLEVAWIGADRGAERP